ncbi:tetratricopeptide repeat protein [Amycolatopsis sp. cmx-4-68]|uniref:tetratricopeptide repeat protein n=1 Tax=Amycolatopsis sp. cmx-4-68 TaxID=2790938 RepID=UPI003978B65B
MLRDWYIWPSTSPENPAVLLAVARQLPPRCILWLPRAVRYFAGDDSELGNLVARELRTILDDERRRPTLILATMTPAEWRQLTNPHQDSGPDPYSHVRLLLAGTDLRVADQFTPTEVEHAAASTDPRMIAAAGAADRYVIQELVATPDMQARYDNASPAAKAVLKCAVDARHTGHGLWLSRELLERGAPSYMPARTWDQLTSDWFESAITELTELGPGGTRLLTHRPVAGPESSTAPGQRYRLDNYLECRFVTEVDHPRLPERHLWPILIDTADRDSLLPIAAECRRRYLFQQASSFYRRAAELDVPGARRGLADMLRHSGRLAEAHDQLWELAEAGDRDAVLEAAEVSLADRKPGIVIESFRVLSEVGNRTALKLTAMAHIDLGQRAIAIGTYRRLAELGDEDAAAVAAALMVEDGSGEAAIDWLVDLHDRHGLNTIPIAADLLIDLNGVNDAIQRLQERADAGDYHLYLLGAQILAGNGRAEEAVAWSERAVARSVHGANAIAAAIHAHAGLYETAMDLAAAAADDGAPSVLTEIAEALAQRRLTQRALTCCNRAGEKGDPAAWPLAATLCASTGAIAEATTYYHRALQTQEGSPDDLAAAIPIRLCRAGSAEKAIDWYIRTVDITSSDALIPVSDFLLSDDLLDVAVNVYQQRAHVSRSRALTWIAEGLARAGELDAAATHVLGGNSGGAVSAAPATSQKQTQALYLLHEAAENYPAARIRLAEIQIQLGRYLEAATTIRENQSKGLLSEADPRLAVALVHQKDIAGARALVEQHLRESRTAVIAPVVLAMFAVKKPNDALKILLRGVDAGDIRAHTVYGDYLVREGHYADALHHYLTALANGSNEVIEKITRILTITDTHALSDLTTYGITLTSSIARPWRA